MCGSILQVLDSAAFLLKNIFPFSPHEFFLSRSFWRFLFWCIVVAGTFGIIYMIAGERWFDAERRDRGVSYFPNGAFA